MKRIVLTLALIATVAGIGLGAVGCNWTETYRDYPPNALLPAHPGHDHDHSHE